MEWLYGHETDGYDWNEKDGLSKQTILHKTNTDYPRLESISTLMLLKLVLVNLSSFLRVKPTSTFGSNTPP